MAFNSSLATSNVTAALVDLGSAWKLDAEYLYAGTDINAPGRVRARTLFVMEVKRSSWFTIIPVNLRNRTGAPSFGGEFSFASVKNADYILNAWFQFRLPAVTLLPGNQFGADGRLRWTRKIGHNIIEDCNITASDQQVARLDNFILDMYAQFMVDPGKQNGYANMIGDVYELTGPHGTGLALSATIPQRDIQVPLPFFFARDSGIALPTAALINNDIAFNIKLRDWNQLLILDNSGAAGSGTVARAVPIVGTDIAVAPTLSNVQFWNEVALVNPTERNRMSCMTRDMVIEQWQSMPRQQFLPVSGSSPNYEPKFVFSIRALMMAIRNRTFANEWSNYSTASPVNSGGNDIDFAPVGATSPIESLSLTYDNNNRFTNMPWHYFNRTCPFYHAPSMPAEIGYGLLSYALNLATIDPDGSTNYSRLSNVQISPTASAAAITAAGGTGAPFTGTDFPQQFEFVLVALSYFVIRIESGSLSFLYI